MPALAQLFILVLKMLEISQNGPRNSSVPSHQDVMVGLASGNVRPTGPVSPTTARLTSTTTVHLPRMPSDDFPATITSGVRPSCPLKPIPDPCTVVKMSGSSSCALVLDHIIGNRITTVQSIFTKSDELYGTLFRELTQSDTNTTRHLSVDIMNRCDLGGPLSAKRSRISNRSHEIPICRDINQLMQNAYRQSVLALDLLRRIDGSNAVVAESAKYNETLAKINRELAAHACELTLVESLGDPTTATAQPQQQQQQTSTGAPCMDATTDDLAEALTKMMHNLARAYCVLTRHFSKSITVYC